MVVYLVHNFRFRQQHQVIVAKLHGLDGLGEPKALIIPDVVPSKVDHWRAGWTVLWQ